ncbi:ribosomal L7Ae/L30e/S12e/Gadd45 family protein [Eubacteriales bacterium OttesenSCG-928-M02]|nr:ribosomal L7Ae/L30e/S12e/Gadd45 family protein [Eubacteriales bacterium OttesenSCG-928-M02]
MDRKMDMTAYTIIGTKQVLRALERGELSGAILADDADPHIRGKLLDALGQKNIPFTTQPSMKALGRDCGIEVGAAVVGKPKE